MKHTRRESPRERAQELRGRMGKFHEIYNAACMLRSAQHSSDGNKTEQVQKFIAVLRRAIDQGNDPEALIFAVADAITAFPYGVPWEG